MNEFLEDEIKFENQVIDDEYMDKLCEHIDIIDENYAYFESNEDGANITSNEDHSKINSSGGHGQITSTGYDVQITSTGYEAEINSSGEYGQITSTGYDVQITSTGKGTEINSNRDYGQITSTGYNVQITSTGKGTEINSSGEHVQITSTGKRTEINSNGDYGQITSTGDGAEINSSGDNAEINSSGDGAEINSSGDNVKINSSGDNAEINSSVDGAEINSSGDNVKINSSGDYAEININGEKTIVFALGSYLIVKAKNGTWITMCEYRGDDSIYTLSVQIGNEEYKDYKGKTLNENEYYCLYNKKIYPVDICDGIKTIKILEKKKDGITIIKGQDLYKYERKIYIVKDNNISAHGATLRKAIEDFNFKKLTLEERRKTLEKIIKEIKETGKVTKPQYRAITGACEFGVNEFCKRNNITVEEISLEELRKILIDDYGAKMFWALIDGRDTSDYIDDFDYEEDNDNEWTNFENISEDIDFSNYGDDDLPF